MEKKKVLVDLSALNELCHGLGQIALSYGRYFEKSYNKLTSMYDLTLLVPDNMIGAFGNEVNYISSSRKLTKRLQFLLPRFDVWHAIHQLSRFKPNSAKTKYILTVHDLNYLYEKKGYRKLKQHYKTQKKIKRADEIVCISEFAKWEVEQHLNLGGKQCKVIYNHVPPLDKELAKKPNEQIKQPFFFSVGVIQEKKNFHVLLDLMKLMPAKHLYIAGKEPEKEQKKWYVKMIRKRIKQENITNVTLLGAVSHEEKIWLFDNCEAFLFPSLLEGFGLPIIEAMQFGKPVFSSKETSLKEIGGSFAYFWHSFNPEVMKTLIDTNLSRFHQNDQLTLEEKEYANSFSYNRHFEKYEELYVTI